MHQQRQNHRLGIVSISHCVGGGRGLDIPNIRPRVCCSQTRKKWQSSRGALSNVSPRRNNQMYKHTVMKQKGNSTKHSVTPKEKPKLGHFGPSQKQTAGTSPLMKVLCPCRHGVWSIPPLNSRISYYKITFFNVQHYT